jgi:tRNA modification GTPase
MNAPASEGGSPAPPHVSELRAAVLTPAGRGAVAVVRVAGPGAATIVGRHFDAATGKPWNASTPGRIAFGRFRPTPQSDQGEELVIVARTSDDVEIHGHGGRAAVDTILQSLAADGCRIVDWREMIFADFADRLAAEATIALAEARTVRTAAVLVDQQAGALRRAVDSIIRQVETGDVAGAADAVDGLLRFAPPTLRLTEPFRVTLAGRPNVGKSSLLNALVGYARAIVFDQPGTTRDVVTAVTAMEGWLVELADTAGRRAAADPLESAGIDRAMRQSAADDLTVLVGDASTPWTTADDELVASIPHALIVHNKCDLAMIDVGRRPPGVAISAITGQGLAELQRAIVERLIPAPPAPGQAVPFTNRQVEALSAARAALQSGETPCVLEALKRL